jgi:hypothetical protein
MKTGSIQQLIDVLEQAFGGLGVSVPDQGLEMIAVTIHKAMSVEARHFHTPEHVLGLVDSTNPIQSLAALFHDIVYHQVDRGFSPEVCEVISPYIVENEGDLFQVRQEILEKRSFALTLEIFGFEPGQVLAPSAGLNEFVSALVMCQKLAQLIPEKELLKAIVYVEATIPFRGDTASSVGPFEVLARRLEEVCVYHGIQMEAAEQLQTIQGAVVFANKDVENFSESDPALFLDNTWKLLPETNIALRSGGVYSLREYRQALQKMYGFLVMLDPETIFHRYRGVPSEQAYLTMQQAATENVKIARQYLGVKLLTVGFLEALAEATGGDAPVSLFIGDTQHQNGDGQHLDDFLPEVTSPNAADISSQVYRLLETGRSSQLYFDMENSPVSLYLYKVLGQQGTQQNLAYACEMFAGHLTPQEFLTKADAGIVSDLAHACAAIVLTRSDKLNQYVHERRS